MENNTSLNFSEIVKQIKQFVASIFDISRDSDKTNTIDDIKAGIYMKGAAAWVLIFSILIASVGLNTSSTAVVIGAMLISPLMGPILGIGLSLGINNIDLLKKALNNFAVMVILSLLTSFLFFSIPIFQNETQELIARTFPDVRDVIIALSGGLSLIIAISQRNKLFNAIAGVAIATALMPPLCTAGYGLATGKWNFFGGALFLFSINTIFIASATFVVVRFLKFPYEEYANSKRRKLLSRAISLTALAILIPSVYMFYQLYKRSDFDQKVDTLIEELKSEKGVLILDVKKDYSKRQINFAVIGKSLSKNEVKEFEQKMSQLGYANCEFKVFQDNGSIETMTKMKDIEQSFLSNQQLLVKKDADLLDKDRQIFDLKNQLTTKKATIMSFEQIAKEMKALDTNIEEVSYAEKLVTNFSKVDTIPTFEIKWNTKVGAKTKSETAQKLENWLKTKLKVKKMEVKVD
ncbi:DUF389 domain-containing protein [Flavobacterium sp. NRK F7]|uniref:DUF389 domain-containing protein n=1 Tax=Flavobacterium sp. NRK F7 TaxID=2954930 RepID=UPI0020906479|nr:DUF389 domain-containing protein [Flavobacterium sp. NRK F7]MCO6164415.1 DUF389 domain-containing protein [Flavobacterium sp. NRK F7]